MSDSRPVSDTPTPEQGLAIQCDACDAVLTVPGGLAFSPPEDNTDIGRPVLKYHLCVDCWEKLERLVMRGAEGYRVVPVPDEDTQLTPSHSATMRELEQTRAERDAAVARAASAQNLADTGRDLAQHYKDVATSALARAEAAEKWQTMWADKWTGAARLLAGAEHERREAQRLREGIERVLSQGLVHMTADVQADLFALLAEQPEGET